MTTSQKNKKKPASARKTHHARKKPRTTKKGLGRLLILAGPVLLLAASLVATLYFVFLRPTMRPGPTDQQTATAVVPEPTATLPSRPQPYPPRPADKPDLQRMPRVAIVIDDMGYRKDTGERLLHLDLNLTFSFLPDGPNSASQAREAWKLGRDILLHLPLEPKDPTWDLGPGGLYVSMTKEKLQTTFAKNLAVVPMAIGINNHMGSLFTENETAMRTLLEVIRAKDLFFIDSITSSKSVGYDLARSMGVKTARRHIFLDNEHENKKVTSQLMKLVAMAEEHDWAIGIAHPYPSTLAVLKEHADLFETRVRLVDISELVR